MRNYTTENTESTENGKVQGGAATEGVCAPKESRMVVSVSSVTSVVTN